MSTFTDVLLFATIKTAIKTMLCCYALDAFLFLAYGLFCRYLNKQKATHLATLPPSHPHSASPAGSPVDEKRHGEIVHADEALADLTDLKNPHFVYIT